MVCAFHELHAGHSRRPDSYDACRSQMKVVMPPVMRLFRSDAFVRDVRSGLRQVRRNPAFSAIAIATLALGIGGVTAMFSAFDSILIRPLPYADADRLVMVWDDMSKLEGDSTFFATPAEWAEWRRLNSVFTDLACSQPGNAI